MHRPIEIPVDSPSQSTRRRHTALLAVLAAMMLCALAGPMLAGKLPLADDLGAFHLPLRAFYSQQLAAGEAFDWWPQLYGGCYITGEGQLGGYHPLHLTLYSALPLEAAFALELWLSYPLMLCGTWLLLRRLGLPGDAALFGGLAFTFAGFNLLHFVHVNAVAVVAHLPWLLWSVDVAVADSSPARRRWARLLFSLLIASQVLLGYPQYVWICGLATVGFFFWRLHAREPSKGEAVRCCLSLAAAGAVGVVIGAIQLLPSVDALKQSVRTETAADFASWGSLHPMNLIQLVAPYAFESRVVGGNTHELGLYPGAVTVVLICWVLVHWRGLGRYRSIAIAACLLGVASLWMAFGEYGLIYKLQAALPVVGKFRFPCRMIVLFHLAAAVLAAIGWLGLARRPDEVPSDINRRWTRTALALVAMSLLAALLAQFVWTEHAAPLWQIVLGPLLIGLAAALVTLADRRRVWALPCLALLAALDWAAYGMSYSVYRDTGTVAQLASESQRQHDLSGPPGRIFLDEGDHNDRQRLRHGNQITLAGWSRIDGYAGLEPRQRLDYRLPNAQSLAGIGPAAMPRAWLVGEARRTSDVKHELPSSAPRQTALVEAELNLSGTPGGEAQVVKDHPGRIRIAVEPTGRQLLVVNESFHSGWQASVDGRPVRLVRAYGDFMGCAVDSDSREVQLVFRPASLRYGVWLSACGLWLLWIAHGFSLWRDRRDIPPESAGGR